jgi:hypothetical protein
MQIKNNNKKTAFFFISTLAKVKRIEFSKLGGRSEHVPKGTFKLD